jgi:hypothetical protein
VVVAAAVVAAAAVVVVAAAAGVLVASLLLGPQAAKVSILSKATMVRSNTLFNIETFSSSD